MQLLQDAILSSTCDYLQVNTAFVISLASNEVETISSVGPLQPQLSWLTEEATPLREILTQSDDEDTMPLRQWHSYWVAPLYSKRSTNDDGEPMLIGVLGLQARSITVDLTTDEWSVFRKEIKRAAETLR